jgi:anti-sigma B factor antagonist
MDELGDPSEPVASAVVTFDAAGVPVIKLSGEIDMSNVDALRVVIEPVIESAPDRVYFDLAALEFMDSSGIALLLRVAATAKTVYVRDPPALVRRLIEATGLSDVLPIDP